MSDPEQNPEVGDEGLEGVIGGAAVAGTKPSGASSQGVASPDAEIITPY